MVKRHMKRIASPASWHLLKKEHVFVTRPRPGAHRLAQGMPLTVVLKELIPVSKTTHEARKVLIANVIKVDGKRRIMSRFITGLFDVISLSADEHYRLMLNSRGRFTAVQIPASEAGIKPAKVLGKRSVRGGRIMLSLSGGRNLLLDKSDVNVGDTVMIGIPKTELKKHLPLREGALIYLQGGRHIGKVGKVTAMHSGQITFTSRDGKEKNETSKAYAVVIGTDREDITLQDAAGPRIREAGASIAIRSRPGAVKENGKRVE